MSRPKLTEHVADVSVPRQGPQLVLAPGEAFVVVPGELHHLKTGGDRGRSVSQSSVSAAAPRPDLIKAPRLKAKGMEAY